MATPGTEACDAVGGALRPKWGSGHRGLLGGSYPSGWPLAFCRLLSLHYFRVARDSTGIRSFSLRFTAHCFVGITVSRGSSRSRVATGVLLQLQVTQHLLLAIRSPRSL